MHTRLGDILIRYYRVREEHITAALADGGFLGEALVRARALTEADLARALGFQLGVPVVLEVCRARISEHVLAAIPRGIAAWEQIVPMSREIDENHRTVLTIATAHPERHALRHELEEITHVTIRFVVATPSDLRAAIRRFYHCAPQPEQETLEITQPSLTLDIGEDDPEHTRPSQHDAPDESTIETSLSAMIPMDPDTAHSTAV